MHKNCPQRKPTTTFGEHMLGHRKKIKPRKVGSGPPPEAPFAEKGKGFGLMRTFVSSENYNRQQLSQENFGRKVHCLQKPEDGVNHKFSGFFPTFQ